MTKLELERQKNLKLKNEIEELNLYVNKCKEEYSKKIEEQKKYYNELLNKKEDSEYQLWKSLNEKFLNKFIEETIKKRLHIKIEKTNSYTTTTLLQYNDDVFSSDFI